MFLFIYFSSVLLRRRIATMSSDSNISTGLSSTITLNDGVVMPLFGLGTYGLSSGDRGDAVKTTAFALQHGYRLFDTAAYYRCASYSVAELNLSAGTTVLKSYFFLSCCVLYCTGYGTVRTVLHFCDYVMVNNFNV